ncbi:MAG: S24 family peptidase [Paludibacteraceae bacterium]
MEKQDVMNQMYKHLYTIGKIENQLDLAKIVGANPATISGAMNGRSRSLTHALLRRINYTFGSIFNPNWIMGASEVMLNKDVVKESEEVYIVQTKTNQKKHEGAVNLYSVEATMGIVSIYEGNKVEVIGEVKIPNMPKSDGAIVARGDSMYPLIKSGAIVAFRKINNTDFFVSGEIYIVDFSIEGDNYITLKYVQTEESDPTVLKLVSYNHNHSDIILPKTSIRFMGLVTAWVNFSTM